MIDEKLEQLKRPFESKDIEWRVQQSGEKNGKYWAMVLAYVTNRAIMDRLDEVFGIGGWKNTFEPTPSMDGVMCGIGIRMKDEWIFKYDGAQNTDIEAVKGGLSSAMKRTAVQFGIGRYLYHLDSGFAKVVDKGTQGAKSAKAKDGKWFYWLPPDMPTWALPASKDQLKEIATLVKQKGANEEEMLNFFGYHKLHNMTKQDAGEVIRILLKKNDAEEAKAS